MTSSIFDIARPSYKQASKEFVDTAEKHGATVLEYKLNDYTKRLKHGKKHFLGLEDEGLSTFVATFGPDDAESACIIDLGMHGPEGFGGLSAIVSMFKDLQSFAVPSSMRLVVIYPTNPYGTSWSRRVTGNNVDLSRNFRLFPIAYDEQICSPDYEELHDAINPKEVSDLIWLGQQTRIGLYLAKHSITELTQTLFRRKLHLLSTDHIFRHSWRKLKTTIASGQYKYKKGMQFGGFEAEAENLIIRQIISDVIPSSVRYLSWINDHVGLGPDDPAYPLIITDFDHTALEWQECKKWFGDSQLMESAHEAYAVSTALPGMGSIDFAIKEEVKKIALNCEIVIFCLEAGVPTSLWDIGSIIMRDNWLHAHGEVMSEKGNRVRAEMTSAFYPENSTWRERCRDAKLRVYKKTIVGLCMKTNK